MAATAGAGSHGRAASGVVSASSPTERTGHTPGTDHGGGEQSPQSCPEPGWLVLLTKRAPPRPGCIRSYTRDLRDTPC